MGSLVDIAGGLKLLEVIKYNGPSPYFIPYERLVNWRYTGITTKTMICVADKSPITKWHNSESVRKETARKLYFKCEGDANSLDNLINGLALQYQLIVM